MSKFFSIEVSDPAYEHGGISHITVKSPALGRRADITVFVPKNVSKAPLAIMLHGVYGSHWAWIYKGGLDRILKRMIDSGEIQPMIVAMPSDGLAEDGSGYLHREDGDYESWIVEDVVSAVQEVVFPNIESNFLIGGISMGGFGAIQLAVRHPSLFVAAAGMSPITRLEELFLLLEDGERGFENIGEVEGLSELLCNTQKQLPAIRFDCGLDDPLLESNRLLHENLKESKIEHIYEEFEGGHDWTYWSKYVSRTLKFFDSHSRKRN